MKRFKLIAVAVAAMVACANQAAFAGNMQTQTYPLYPTSADFPDAWGSVSLRFDGPSFDQDLHVKFYWYNFQFGVGGLEPYARYGLYTAPKGELVGLFTTGEFGTFGWGISNSTVLKKFFPQGYYVVDEETGLVVLSSQ
jgi:hypothetical protein